MLLAVLRGSLVQPGVTAMEDEHVIQLHDLVDLILVEVFQSFDRSIGCNAYDE